MWIFFVDFFCFWERIYHFMAMIISIASSSFVFHTVVCENKAKGLSGLEVKLGLYRVVLGQNSRWPGSGHVGFCWFCFVFQWKPRKWGQECGGYTTGHYFMSCATEMCMGTLLFIEAAWDTKGIAGGVWKVPVIMGRDVGCRGPSPPCRIGILCAKQTRVIDSTQPNVRTSF